MSLGHQPCGEDWRAEEEGRLEMGAELDPPEPATGLLRGRLAGESPLGCSGRGDPKW